MLKAPTPLNEAERLKELQDFLILDSDPELAFDDLTKLASEISQTPISLISLIDRDRQWFKSKVGLDAAETPRDISFCGHAIMGDEIFEIPDAGKDDRFKDNPLYLGEPHVRFYAGAPLKTTSGQRIGTLCVIDSQPKQLTDWQKSALEKLANQVVLLIEARLREKKLAVTNEKFDAIVNNIPIMICSHNEKKDLEWANKQWIKELGWDPHQKKTDELFCSLYPNAVARESVHTFLNKHDGSWNTFETTTKDGNQIYTSWTNVELEDRSIICIGQNVHERRLAEIERDQTNQKLEYILDCAQLGSWDWWVKDNKVQFDRRWCEALGLEYKSTRMEMLSREERIHPEDKVKAEEEIKQHIEGKTPLYQNIQRMKHQNGHWKWVLERGQISERDEKGTPVRFTGTQLDITKQKEIEQDLRDNQEKVLAIYEGSNDAIFIFNNNQFIDCNKRTLDLFKIETKEKFNINGLEILSPERQPDGEDSYLGFKHHIQEAYRTGLDRFDWTFKKSNGDEFPAEVLLSAFELSGKKTLQATVRDISRRKNLENLTREVERIAKIGGWELTLTPQHLKFTDEVYRIHGLPLGSSIDLEATLALYSSESSLKLRKNIQDAIQNCYPWDDEYEFEDSKGITKWCRIIGEAISNDLGVVTRLKGTFQDITEKKNLEKNLEEQRKISQHHAKLATIGQLAAGVGHEINNPLAIIKGYINALEMLLKENQYNDNKTFSILNKTNNACDRIVNIVKTLRTFSRSDVDVFTNFCLSDVVTESYNLINEIYQKEGVQLMLSNPKQEKLFVYGNKGRLEQVIFNLIANAKDSTEGQRDRKIQIEIAEVSGFASLKVTDNGKGIPENIKDKIFDPFFTTKDVNKGTGMGLSIVSSIIKEHNGDIFFDSTTNQGTTFTMLLPLHEVTNIQVSSETKYQRPASQLRDLTVLVVDDEEDIRQIAALYLNETVGKVVTATNGQDALNLLSQTNFDLVVSDVKMPIMNGIELVKNLRKSNLHSPKILLMTGGIDNAELHELKSQSLINGFIDKPFSLDAFNQKLKLLFPEKN